MNKDETHLWYVENCISKNRSGIHESPINIDDKDVRKCLNLDSIVLDYALPNSQSPTSISSSLVKNTGCSWQVEVPGELNHTLQSGPLGEKIFKLAYYTAHWGRSEHTVNEISYDGELHFVHYNTRYPDAIQRPLSTKMDLLSLLSSFRNGILSSFKMMAITIVGLLTLNWRRLSKFFPTL